MERHDLHEAPLEQWGEIETHPFKAAHIDHSGQPPPSSNWNTHCFVVVYIFLDSWEPILSETQELKPRSTHYKNGSHRMVYIRKSFMIKVRPSYLETPLTGPENLEKPFPRVLPIHHGLTAKLKYKISILLATGQFS